MSSDQKVLLLQVKTDCGKEGQTYLDFDFITKNPSLLLPNVQQIAWDLLPGVSEIQASYMDGDGDRCTLTDQTASDALHFAVGGSNEVVLEMRVQDKAKVGEKSPAMSCVSCVQLKARLSDAKKSAAEAETSKANAEKELSAANASLQAKERDLAELREARAEIKRKSDEIARLTALCETLQAEVVSARQQRLPRSENSEKLSASVSECAPLILGIEAYEDQSRRGCVGQNFKDMAEKLGSSQAHSLGCMIVTSCLDGKTNEDSVPTCTKFTVVNDGSVPWPETTVAVNVKGDSFGVPIVHLGAKGPGESEEIVMDLLVPPNSGNNKACSIWSVINAATGTPLGPAVVLEIEWRSQ